MNSYRFVLRAYPADYREEIGPELVGIANDTVGERWSARQSSSLLAGGMRVRARQATGCSPHEVWASGVRAALLASIFVAASSGLVEAIRRGSKPDVASVLVLAATTIVALTVSTRWWIALLVTAFHGWIVYVSVRQFGGRGVLFVYSNLILAVVAVAAAWWLALAGDGRRAASPTTVGLLATAIASIAGFADAGLAIIATYVVAIVTMTLGGLVLSRHDPRLAASGTIFVLFFVALSIPFLFANQDTGLGYWGPIVISVSVLSVMAAATWSGTRRLVRA